MAILSSQHHSFDVALAAKYGMECAVLIHHFQHWIRINQFAKRNIREGSCWTYQTRKEILEHFPYWSFDEVRRLCEKLVAFGVLKTANFNKSMVDKTLWYAFVDEKAFGVDANFSRNVYERQICPSKGKIAFPEGKIATPIPDTKPYSKTTNRERERKESTLAGAKEKSAAPPTRTFFCFGNVKMSQEEADEIIKQNGMEKFTEYVNRLHEHSKIKPTSFKKYACHSTVIRKWIREDSSKEKNRQKHKPLSNKQLAKNIQEQIGRRNGIDFGEDGICFSNGPSQKLIKFVDVDFKEQVLNRLHCMGIPIGDL